MRYDNNSYQHRYVSIPLQVAAPQDAAVANSKRYNKYESQPEISSPNLAVVFVFLSFGICTLFMVSILVSYPQLTLGTLRIGKLDLIHESAQRGWSQNNENSYRSDRRNTYPDDDYYNNRQYRYDVYNSYKPTKSQQKHVKNSNKKAYYDDHARRPARHDSYKNQNKPVDSLKSTNKKSKKRAKNNNSKLDDYYDDYSSPSYHSNSKDFYYDNDRRNQYNRNHNDAASVEYQPHAQFVYVSPPDNPHQRDQKVTYPETKDSKRNSSNNKSSKYDDYGDEGEYNDQNDQYDEQYNAYQNSKKEKTKPKISNPEDNSSPILINDHSPFGTKKHTDDFHDNNDIVRSNQDNSSHGDRRNVSNNQVPKPLHETDDSDDMIKFNVIDDSDDNSGITQQQRKQQPIPDVRGDDMLWFDEKQATVKDNAIRSSNTVPILPRAAENDNNSRNNHNHNKQQNSVDGMTAILQHKNVISLYLLLLVVEVLVVAAAVYAISVLKTDSETPINISKQLIQTKELLGSLNV